jgi:hypothetical protein
MSDFTTTPNLGLYKPTYDADDEMWGFHLNANADILDSALPQVGVGVFLPLAGGTLAGGLVLSGDAAAPLNPVTLRQLNAAGAAFLPLATGGTVAGATTFSAAGTGLAVTNNATVSGTIALGISTNANTVMSVNGATGTQRRLEFQTAGVLRWRVGASQDAEGGAIANSGSSFYINAFSDTGGSAVNALTINRATQQAMFQKIKMNPSSGGIVYGGVAPDPNNSPFFLSSSFSGTVTGTAWTGLTNFTILNDTVGIDPGAQAIGFYGQHFWGGAAATGSRTGMYYLLQQSSNVLAHANSQAALFNNSILGNSGGTNVWDGSAGASWGAGIYCQQSPGGTGGATPTNRRLICGAEIDYGANAGSVNTIVGLSVTRWANAIYVPPVYERNSGISVTSAQGGTGSATIGLMFGSCGGQYPVTSNGALIRAAYTANYRTVPMSSSFGVELTAPDFPIAAWRSKGMSIMPDGSLQVGSLYIQSDHTSSRIDSQGFYTATVAITSGGANLYNNLPLIDDVTGLHMQVTASSGGVATAVAILREGFATGTPPASITPRVVSLGILDVQPTAPVIAVTWVSVSALNLNPSGGPVTVNNLPVRLGATLYTTTTSVGNGADTTDDILQTFVVPAGTLASVGDRLVIEAGGTLSASTDNKSMRVRLNAGISIAGCTVTAAAQASWALRCVVMKSGANTQSVVGICNANNVANGTSGLQTVTDTAPITITITGQNATNPVAGSITCRFMSVEYAH